MSFSNYKSLSAVVRKFAVVYQRENFVQSLAFKVSDYFKEDLKTVMQYGVVDNSESAICENLVYPILKEVWKSYYNQFVLWSHEYLGYTDDLSGFPEYILAEVSPLGRSIFDKPYFLLVEAKQDKFDEGWGQCLAEMIAAQKLNDSLPITLFGIVSNGKFWEFGKLENNIFTKNSDAYTLSELDKLFGIINYIFNQCQLQLNQAVAP